MKTIEIIRDGVNMGDPPSDSLDGALTCSVVVLPTSYLSAMRITDSGFNTFDFSKGKLSWQESIAIEQLKTVKWLAIGG